MSERHTGSPNMMSNLLDLLFAVDVLTLLFLLLGGVWSLAYPSKRIWPPPGEGSWQHRLTWVCFCAVFLLNAAILVLDWNSWLMTSNVRFLLGAPIAAMGAFLVAWAIATLGTGNTSGLPQGLISAGPYRFTRNPQYLGDMILFVGLSLIANSTYLWIAHALLILVFIIAPLAEEPWLEEQYGQAYVDYKRRTRRFL